MEDFGGKKDLDLVEEQRIKTARVLSKLQTTHGVLQGEKEKCEMKLVRETEKPTLANKEVETLKATNQAQSSLISQLRLQRDCQCLEREYDDLGHGYDDARAQISGLKSKIRALKSDHAL